MKLLLLLVTLSAAITVFADKNPPRASYGTNSIFYNGETLPKFKTKIEFNFPHCGLDSRLLNIERRDSRTQLDNPDTGKKVDVRYVYLIGHMPGTHKSCPSKVENTTIQYQIESDPNLMTHFFVSIEVPAKIESIKNNEQ
jgi:hypothetical protein